MTRAGYKKLILFLLSLVIVLLAYVIARKLLTTPGIRLNGTWVIGTIDSDGTFSGPKVNDPKAGTFQINVEEGIWIAKGPNTEYKSTIVILEEDDNEIKIQLDGKVGRALFFDDHHVQFRFPGVIIEVERASAVQTSD